MAAARTVGKAVRGAYSVLRALKLVGAGRVTGLQTAKALLLFGEESMVAVLCGARSIPENSITGSDRRDTLEAETSFRTHQQREGAED